MPHFFCFNPQLAWIYFGTSDILLLWLQLVLVIAGQRDIQYSWLTISYTSVVTSVKPVRLLLFIDRLLLGFLFLCLLLFRAFHFYQPTGVKYFDLPFGQGIMCRAAMVKHGTDLVGTVLPENTFIVYLACIWVQTQSN